MAFPQIREDLFANNGAGPKLRDDIVPWDGIPWDGGPLASPVRSGLAPAGGLAGQVFRVNEAGDAYGWADAPVAAIIGKIDLLPFRPADLAAHAPGWRFCNGDLYPLSGAVGAALNALPATFKADWGIVVSGTNISIPKMFYSDGRGYFLRAVAGTTRLVGSVETDALQQITGSFSPATPNGQGYGFSGNTGVTGAFYMQSWMTAYPFSSGGSNNDVYRVMFDSGRTTRSGTETRALNIGMTPAIYLGV